MRKTYLFIIQEILIKLNFFAIFIKNKDVLHYAFIQIL